MTAAPLTLRALLAGVDGARIDGDAELAVSEVRDDSRLVERGDLFVAVPGRTVDGRTFLGAAIARGAAAVLIEATREGARPAELAAFPGAVVLVPSARRALGAIAANRHQAARALTLLAVTGTNGKTTTTYIVESMLRAAGLSPGVVGTVTYRAAGLRGGARPAPLTTPGALDLHALFAEMREASATDVVLEASSQALEQGRLDGCSFRVVAMTNLTQDHLDYHGDMGQYFEAKAILFQRLVDAARGVSVTFVDDQAGREMRKRASGVRLGVARVAGARGADVVVEAAELGADGTRATLVTPVGRLPIESPLVGDYNLANLALATGMAVARGLPADAIVAGAADIAVPGRLERVANDRDVLCVVDYAHTPDGLERAIGAMRPLTRGRLIVVFGCGGDRDPGKRPIMGEIGARDADLAIVTSDNPRTEDPEAIVAMVLEGVRRTGARALAAGDLADADRGYHAEVDRRRAIQAAAAAARAGDVLLIAGKGHEDYQILGKVKVHFDDREEAAAALAVRP
jgi:UDP-N-acetylmuramoyl-L-alanyl-D-glutamate--2,6-diaminopimelate ligase